MDATKARELLEQRRRDLEKLARIAGEGSADESGDDAPVEPAELATETLEREVGLSIKETAEASLIDVDRALKRLEDGSYGLCVACGKPIPDGRLEAKPEAEYDIAHQPSAAAQPS
jgi:RNA polymerase-binding transcription factor DksA